MPCGLAEQVSNARRCQTRRAAISCRPEQVHLQRFSWRIRFSTSSGTGERVTSGTYMPKATKSTKFGLPWPTRSHPPAPPRPTPRAQDQVATLPLSGSFRCFELPFSRRGWPWCCIKILFWGALEGDRLAALRRTGAARTRGWVIAGDRGSTGPPKKLTQKTVNSRTLLATTDAHTRAPSLVVPPRSKPLIPTRLLLGFLRLHPVSCRPCAVRAPCS